MDRDSHFKRSWLTVLIELSQGDSFIIVEANSAKKSFWGPKCRELIDKDIGRWMLNAGMCAMAARYAAEVRG